MIPLLMTDDPPVIRRWCETCGRYTRSRIDCYGDERCAEHEFDAPEDYSGDSIEIILDDWEDEDD